MPDTPALRAREQGAADPAPPAGGSRNLPVPVPAPARGHDGWLTRVVRAIFRWKPGTMRADLEVVLEGGGTGVTGFSPNESAMLKNILSLRERRIEDVMIPRADIIAVQHDISLGELVRTFENAGHSRLVVYNDTLDDPVGMVHIRDLIGYMTARAAVEPKANTRRKKPLPANLDLRAIDLSEPLSGTKIVREILFVPPSMPATELLARMQATRIHLALVIDEYGGTDGLVSIEDIVEQIVGDISDEHDNDEKPAIVAQPDGSFLADARASLEDVVAKIGPEFDIGDVGDTVDTLGGYLFNRARRVPVRGELVPGPGAFEFEVVDADPRRVKKVRIHRSRAHRIVRDADGRRRAGPVDVTPVPAPVSAPASAPASAPTAKPAPDVAAAREKPPEQPTDTSRNTLRQQ